MCTISIEPKNNRTKKEIKNLFDNNSDGTGFAYSNGNKIIINKYRDFNKFYTDYLTAKKSIDTNHLFNS